MRWKADNYNHLFEQPTLFYAVAIVLALVTRDAGTDAMLAWTYVAVRVLHSLVQATINKIEVRFALFFVSSLVLAVMTARAAIAVTLGAS
ncbi:MAPEG family protein [Nannocystis sp.]|uniref:MAPEG family protein n=1 Tax=Nannocystis sp. TaxID=1962667 RepID=UPI00344F0F58